MESRPIPFTPHSRRTIDRRATRADLTARFAKSTEHEDQIHFATNQIDSTT